MTAIVQRTLDCGMRLLVEPLSGVRSVGLSWLLPAGYGAEPADRLGLSAMWSELVMRGAGGRTSREQADAVDRLGVGRSADVGPYHLRVGASLVGDKLHDALPLLVDMVRRPLMSPESIEQTRDLALQAVESLKDNPRDRASLNARARHFPAPLNRASIGTREGITAVTRDDLMDRWAERARPGGSILAIAGAVDPDAAARRLNELLKGWTGSAPDPRPGTEAPRGYAHEIDETNQVQIILLHDAPPEPEPASLLERVVASILSGGMAGRLFTEVREKRGLCYAVGASYTSSREYGAVSAYVGTTPERAQESLDVLWAELDRINKPEGAVRQDEFDRAVVGMKSRLVFSGESTSARSAALAHDEHRIGRPRTLDELAADIDRVTLDSVNSYLASRTMGLVTIQTLGPAPLRPPA